MDLDHDGNSDDTDGSDHGYSAPAADPVLIALQLCAIANNKTLAAAIKKLRRLDRQFADAQSKLAAVEEEAAAIAAKAESDASAIAARERVISERETELENSLKEARDHLRAYYDRIADADRRLRYHVLASADLLHGYNEQLQMLPDWPAIKRMVPGLPDDPPSLEREQPFRIDAIADTFSDPTADRHGAQFLGTLTRSISHKATSQ